MCAPRCGPATLCCSGVDLVKDAPDDLLAAAYDDAEGVTAAFNRNVLRPHQSGSGRRTSIRRRLHPSRGLEPRRRRAWRCTWSACPRKTACIVYPRSDRHDFRRSECIHTENSYKYMPGQAEAMLAKAGFTPNMTWTDRRGWFSVVLGRALVNQLRCCSHPEARPLRQQDAKDLVPQGPSLSETPARLSCEEFPLDNSYSEV